MEQIASERLMKEKQDFRKNRPSMFYANPMKKQNGTKDLYKWECGIPGPKNSPWEGGLYKLTIEFPEDYPAAPPKCKFNTPLFHPNIYPSGTVCLSILNEEEDWRPTLKVRDVLLGIQELLANPNEKSPAQLEAYQTYINNRDDYNNKVKKIARDHIPKL